MSEESTTQVDAQETPAKKGELSNQSNQSTQQQDHMIPKHRFDQINTERNELKKRLEAIERDQQQREEERAQAQGEYQALAEKRQKKIDSLQNEVQSLKNQIVRDSRYRVWTQAAAGVIRPNAIGDAFDMISNDEWDTVNLDDEGSVKNLAQNLADRKDYLALSPTGNGSIGSKEPVFGLASNKKSPTGTQGSRPTMHFKKSRPHWK